MKPDEITGAIADPSVMRRSPSADLSTASLFSSVSPGEPEAAPKRVVTCQECGAPLPDGGACIDHFHSLLLLEYEVAADPVVVAGDRGKAAHFYAVSSYVLQHPEGMNYTTGALAGVRRGLQDHLDGKITLAEQLRRVRTVAEGAARITRRAGDEVVRWPVESWPLTVLDVVEGGVGGYCERVAAWAQSILRTLDEAGG